MVDGDVAAAISFDVMQYRKPRTLRWWRGSAKEVAQIGALSAESFFVCALRIVGY
jgi:hypothetical protein